MKKEVIIQFPRDDRDTQRMIHKIIYQGEMLGFAGLHDGSWWAGFRFAGNDFEIESRPTLSTVQSLVRRIIQDATEGNVWSGYLKNEPQGESEKK